MNIEFKEIPIRQLVEGYQDNNDAGVVGYGGKLDIRPPYQREFIYKDKQRDAVIDTVVKNFPLNVMYWAAREDGNFEVIDGQQRTISICQYITGDFSVKVGTFPENRGFHNLQKDEQDQILDYKLMVYLCSGTDSEKLEWFRTINIAGEKLTDQELRNAVYSGPWVTDAKRYFSKSGCPAYGLGSDYMSGTPIRQDYLETVISWVSNDNIESYMLERQHNSSAADLWFYFTQIINWVQTMFPKYRKEMKGIEWGKLYNDHHSKPLDPAKLEAEISKLMIDEDVDSKKGIYNYVLTREEKHLNIRRFSDNMRREAYERQGGVCPVCQEQFTIDEMDADHITPWSLGGKTVADNCQMLCKEDNRRKAGR